MKKVFKMEDLDCANCAAKMERAIAGIEGVSGVNVNFMSAKLTIESEESKFDDIMKQVVKVCRKIEPDCKIVF